MTALVEPEAQGANLAERAHAALLRRILLRQIPPGAPLIEERLARELTLSRTPLREALVRLAGEGLLVKHGRSPYAVRYVGAHEYFQSLRVRLLLEPEAAALAAGRIDDATAAALAARIRALAEERVQVERHWDADDALHGLVAGAAGNPILARTIADLRVWTRLFELTDPFDRVGPDAEEHLAILEAVAAGRAEAARRAMQRHLKQLERLMTKRISGA